jgi:hypothetical protein
MNRARLTSAALVVGSAMFTGAVITAQVTQAPPMTQVLAGKKFTPPVRGEALVEIVQPVTKAQPGKNIVVTTIKVRNASQAPIARLQVTETWYDKGGTVVASSRAAINGLIQPQEVQTMTIETAYSPKLSSNNWNFTHANGTVKIAKVKSLDAPKDAAAPPPPAAKK